MPVSVRLDEETEELLKETSRILKAKKSVVIKESIKEYCTPLVKGKRRSPYELVQDLIENARGAGEATLQQGLRRYSERGSGKNLDTYRYRAHSCPF